MENNNDLIDIFLIVSRIILLAPIIVIIVGLILRFNQKEARLGTMQTIITPTVFNSPTPTPKSSPVKLDLNGPFVCQGEIDQASVSAFIKDKKIRLIVKKKSQTENILLLEDCYYKWSDSQFTGEKICGLSPLIQIADTMMQFGGSSFSRLINQLGIGGAMTKNNDQITAMANACKKQTIIDNNAFTPPTNILFKNNVLPTIPKLQK